MVSKDLLEILCCPTTKQPLQEASSIELEKINSTLAKGKEKLEAALLTMDKKYAYPIRNKIPVLLAEECISI
jgi:uncharacterized protein YbaR (Trm112 family)